MKKLLLTSVLALGCLFGANAEKVSTAEASDYAVRFLNSRTQKTYTVNTIEQYGDVYIVNLNPGGWVIVSTDDAALPVIGYNASGALNRFNMPSNMQGMLKIYSEGVRTLARDVVKRNAAWNTTGTMSRAEGSPVTPLIKVNWNQTEPFWKYCPKSGGDALVGCVAVATSQAMSVQQYPDRPTGYKSYTCANYGRLTIDFDAEPPYNWDNILSGANRYDEAARLLFHAGMGVEMMYGTNGSGVYTNRLYIIRDALVNNFKYKADEVQYSTRAQYRGDWEQMLLSELQAGRAIVYNGVDEANSAGHSFNLDGFDGKGLFHVNWGWGGTGNGYFSLAGLSYGGQTYSDQQSAVYGIGSPNKNLRKLEFTDYIVERGTPVGHGIASVLINGEFVTSEYEVTVNGSRDGNGGYNDIPFSYDNGMVKLNRNILDNEQNFHVEVTAKHKASGESMTQGYTINVVAKRPLDQASSVSYDRAKKVLTVHSKHNTVCTITNANGAAVVSNQTMQPMPQVSVDRSLLSSGRNTVTLKNGNDTKTFVIVLP